AGAPSGQSSHDRARAARTQRRRCRTVCRPRTRCDLGKDTGMSPRRPLLVNADDLEHWSDRYEAAAKLPLLVRRLVLAARGVTNVSFRTEAGVRLAGWDGFCEGTEPNPYVAVGPAGWEFSVQ